MVDMTNLDFEALQERLSEWQHYYNWQRVHGATGKTPIDRFSELIDQTPFSDEVAAQFDLGAEAARLAAQLKPTKGKK